MRLLIAAAMGLLIGCSTDVDELANSSWILDLNASCSMGATFGAAHEYAFLTVCTLADGSNGLEEEAGAYEIAGKIFLTTPTKATCPADSVMGMSFPFSLSGDTLTMQSQSTLLVFQRNTATGGNGAAQLGCFDASGTFAPGRLNDL